MEPAPPRPKVMRVSTRCRSVDEFIAAFATLVDEHSIVVYTNQTREIGARQLFAVQLADGEMVMRGEGEVMESEPPPRGKLRLRFLSMDSRSHEVHKLMMERGRGLAGMMGLPAAPAPRPAPGPATPAPVRASTSVGAPGALGGKLPGVPPIPELPVKGKATMPLPVMTTPPAAAKTAPAAAPQTPVAPVAVTPPGAKLPAPTRKAWSPGIPSIPMAQPIGPTVVTTSDLAAGTSRRAKPVTPELATGTPPPAAPPVAAPAPAPAPTPTPAPVVADGPDLDDIKTAVDTSVPDELRAKAAAAAAAAPPPTEERTPGSPYILPANPFGELDPKALEYFVECTIYEETGKFEIAEIAADAAGNAEAIADLGETIEPPPPAPPPAPASHPYPSVPIAALSAMDPQPLPPPVMPAPGWPDEYADDDTPAPAPRTRMTIWIAAAVAVIVIVGVLALVLGGGDDDGEARRAAAGTGAPDAKGKPAIALDAGAAQAVDPPAAAIDAGAAVMEPATPDAAVEAALPDVEPPPRPSTGDCKLAITSNEPGSEIRLDGVKVGQTPWSGKAPCGAVKIVVSRPRHAPFEESVELRPGATIEVDARMVRPDQKVTFTSNPAGAIITVDGKRLGKAPVSATVKGFTKIKVSAELAGYAPASQSLYVKKTTTRVGLTLKKAVKRPRR